MLILNQQQTTTRVVPTTAVGAAGAVTVEYNRQQTCGSRDDQDEENIPGKYVRFSSFESL
jgi:hypothetical protein